MAEAMKGDANFLTLWTSMAYVIWERGRADKYVNAVEIRNRLVSDIRDICNEHEKL